MPSIAQVEPMTTARALRGPFDYRLPDELRGGVVDVGSMLVVPFARRHVLGVVVGLSEHSEIAEEKLLAPLRALELGVPVELVALAEWIAAEYCSTIARALTLVLPPGAARRLSGRKRRGGSAIVRSQHLPVGRRPPADAEVRWPSLTSEQQQALESLNATLDGHRFERRLLQGVTGSGKTEVYLRAAANALEQGRGAIVLVPEIALTPQIVGRFQERFGETVAVLHSRLRPGERYEEWRRLRTGEARVCVGPRSAVFAPIERLGLIVVDEEHDASYKHEGDPRYDARDVAAERARASRALLLLGSATPRPESVHRAASRPTQAQASPQPLTPTRTEPPPLLRLSARVDGRPLPDVGVLDMRGESGGLHPATVQALAQVRAERGKAIVLLNRRGWSNFLSCRSCGRVWSCPQCDVALVLHRHGGFLACHHCGHRERAPESCEQCGSVSVARHGAGTERVQHDLAAALDGGDGRFSVLRLDADTVGTEGVAPLLRRFETAEAGVLIGTQMVAKGHDFADVTLGVVLDADATLRFPDFRAEERTFALIAQLAGRVGRGSEGRVLVQTIAPEARAIAHAARHDSDGFLAGELERREALRYPPFSHLIRIVCSAPESAPARAAASAVAERLGQATASGTSVLGPAALFRLRGQERQVLVIKAAERRPAVRAAGEAVRDVADDRAHRGVSFSVDVDPQ
jgi:primosomal protein N' (replication factor Y) (superfamily II helicase)